MIRCILFSFFFLSLSVTQGQQNVHKGNKLVGASIGVGHASRSFTHTTSTLISFNPSFGGFFANRWAGGVEFNLSDSKVARLYFLSPYLRYYFLKPTGKVNLFTQGSFGVGFEGEYGGQGHIAYQYAVLAGPSIFISPRFAIDVAFSWASAGANDINRMSVTGVSVGFRAHLFGKRKEQEASQ